MNTHVLDEEIQTANKNVKNIQSHWSFERCKIKQKGVMLTSWEGNYILLKDKKDLAFQLKFRVFRRKKIWRRNEKTEEGTVCNFRNLIYGKRDNNPIELHLYSWKEAKVMVFESWKICNKRKTECYNPWLELLGIVEFIKEYRCMRREESHEVLSNQRHWNSREQFSKRRWA